MLRENAAEAAVVEGLHAIPVPNPRVPGQFLTGEIKIVSDRVDLAQIFSLTHCDDLDHAQVKGQESVERVLPIALAGFHNALLIGVPALANPCWPTVSGAPSTFLTE